MTSRPQVLLIAYQCAPGQGSVSQIGWEWYSRLAQRARLTLVTHIRNKAAFDAQGPPAHDAEVIYIDTEAFAGPLYRLSSALFPRSQHTVFLISSLDFYVFDRKAVATLKQMQRRGRSWDIAHLVTPVSPWASPTLHRLHIPTILGPWNGGLETPTAFPELMKQDSAWLYPIRNLGRLFELLNRGIRSATAVLVATQATQKLIAPRYNPHCLPMLENGVDLSSFPSSPWPPSPSSTQPLRIVFVGRLVPFKGVSLLLKALSTILHNSAFELAIVGDGPERERLEKLSQDLALHSHVRFVGAQPLPAVADAMRAAHVFCLPSVRESGGAVVLEAMASARPVIVIKHGGPAEIVDDSVGHAIDPLGPDFVISELAKTLQQIISHPDAWQQKGLNGRIRAEQRFGWERKIDAALEIYARVTRANSRDATLPETPLATQTSFHIQTKTEKAL